MSCCRAGDLIKKLLKSYYGDNIMNNIYQTYRIRHIPKVIINIGILFLTLLATTSTYAVTIMATDFNDNDCAGFFNPPGETGFDSCQVFFDPRSTDPNAERVLISPVIGKFDGSSGVFESNTTDFPSITGVEWTFDGVNPVPGSGASGNWVYTPNDITDPGIRFVAAKAGRDFILFWEIAAPTPTCDTSGPQTAFTLDCLNLAMTITAGSWQTPEAKTLSHITFYNSDPVVMCIPGTPGCGPRILVSEPNILALFFSSLLIIGHRRHQKQTKIIGH